MKPGGKVILVEAGAQHLSELRTIIYPKDKAINMRSIEDEAREYEKAGFSKVGHQTLQFQTQLDCNLQINNLLQMTPHLFRASAEGKAIAAQLEELEITVDIVFRTLQKS